MSEFFLQIHCEFDSFYSLIIEDDGRVAYAYLYWGEDIVGDVWLYNQLSAPNTTFWTEEEMPFLNPVEYLKPNIKISPLVEEGEVRCEWTESPDNGSIEVGVYIRDKFIASISAGSKPGWSVLVVKDGPLALVY